MEYDKEKLQKMRIWILETMPSEIWIPENGKSLSEDQAIYIERVMELDSEIRQLIEFNCDFSRVRKADHTGYKFNFIKLKK